MVKQIGHMIGSTCIYFSYSDCYIIFSKNFLGLPFFSLLHSPPMIVIIVKFCILEIYGLVQMSHVVRIHIPSFPHMECLSEQVHLL